MADKAYLTPFDEKQHKTACGIYAIRNLTTGRIYIGQSRCIGGRIKFHLNAHKRGDANGTNRLLLDDVARGFKFSIFIVEVLPDDPEVMTDRERFWIAHFKGLEGGVYNLNENASWPIRHSKESREKIADSHRKRLSSPMAREQVSANFKALWADPAFREKMIAAKQSPEVRAKMSASAKAASSRPEVKLKRSEAQKRNFKDPEYRARMDEWYRSAGRNSKISTARRNSLASQDVRQELSENQHKRWKDDAYRASMIASMNTEEARTNRAAASAAAWNDPEIRRRRNEGQKRSWENPERRAKVSGANNKGARPVINLDTGEKFPTIVSAAKSVGRPAPCIRQAIMRNSVSAGFRWAYLQKD